MKNNEKLLKNCNISNPNEQINTKNNKELIKNSVMRQKNLNETKLKDNRIFQNHEKILKISKNNEKLLKNLKNSEKINKNSQKNIKNTLKNEKLIKKSNNLRNIKTDKSLSKNNKNTKNNSLDNRLDTKSKNRKNFSYNATSKLQTNKVCGIEISSPEKILFKKDKITKLDVANFYNDIAPQMLKFLNKRLLSVIRCHVEANESCFFKKHPTTDKNFVNSVLVDGEEYFYISSNRQLVMQAQLGTVEFHIWGSMLPNIDQPNLMVFDLDPAPDVSLEILRKACLLVKDVLDELKLKSFLKTSGGKGYHICVPFKKKLSWDEFADFSHNIALLLEQKYPDIFTTTIKKSARKGKIFIDYLRNKKGATCVAPFSLRARPHAPISFPISWADLNKISPNEINIKNYKNYLNS